MPQINGTTYERVDCIGRGGSSRVFSVLCPTTRNVLALKRVTLDRADKQTVDNYLNEISLLQRLKGHDQIIRLIDHQVIYGTRMDRPKSLLMVSGADLSELTNQLMECGEIAFDSLLDEQRGKPVNMNFVGLYWEQVSSSPAGSHLTIDAASRARCPPGKGRTHRSQARQLCPRQRPAQDHRLWYRKGDCE